MSEKAIIAIVTGVVVVLVVIVLRKRIKNIDVPGVFSAATGRDGIRQRGIEATGNVVARDGTGQGAAQENIKGHDVTAVVTQPGNGDSPKA